MKFVVVIVLMLGAVAKAQKPQPCESPKEWQARAFQHYYAEDVSAFNMGELSYDAVNERVSFYGETRTEKSKGFFDVINLYKEKKQYVLYRDEKNPAKCTVTDLNEPFRPIGLPSNNSFEGEAYVGSNAVPGAGLLTYLGGGEASGGFYMVSVTATGCVPVHTDEESKEKKTASHFRFFDALLGVDPERFVPSDICKEKADGEAELIPNFLSLPSQH